MCAFLFVTVHLKMFNQVDLERKMEAIQLQLFNTSNNLQKQTRPSRQISEVFNFEYGSGWPDIFGKNLYNWATSALSKPIKTLSLFSGGGGLDIGFHDAGFSILNMVEVDERFVETLKANCGNSKYFNHSRATCIDIRDFTPIKDLDIDFMIGGPPCQTFSAAGRRAAGVQGTDDERGMLFWEYVRILENLSPAGFLFENVYGITGAQNGEAWQQIKEAFANAGYRIFHRILDAADYGVPQHRERLFIVGVKEGNYRFPKPTHGPDSIDDFPYYSASNAIKSLTANVDDLEFGIGGRYGQLLNDIPPGLNYSFYTAKMGHPNPVFAWRSKFSDFLYKADPNEPVRTIKAQGGQYTGPFHWNNRRFTISELKRLQTFPDNYQISGGKQVAIQQIGNSVPPQIARILALSILEQVFEVELPIQLPKLHSEDKLHFRQRKRKRTKIYQQRARIAIEQLPDIETLALPYSRKFHCRLSHDFGLDEVKFDELGNLFGVYSKLNAKHWQLNLSLPKSINIETVLRIVIKPTRNKTWTLPVEQVALNSSILSPKAFSVIWKAFEIELNHLDLKADLVQLGGYYQYTPNFQCEMKIELDAIKEESDFCWDIVRKVVNGEGTRKIFSTIELSQLWNTSSELVPLHANQLKSVGFEVRNSNTNPQIPENCFLIPYSFPTLTPKSVQLHKKL